MNRMMKIALGAVLVGFALPVFAQDNFPDVPDNHWAYEAVEGMKKAGCLVGYPDGMYRGGRPMSRYEFACAAYACYQKMMGMYSDMSKQIDELKDAIKNMKPGGDTTAMQAQLDSMKSQLDGMKGWGARISDLEKMSKEFEKDIAGLGVDVKKMQQDIGGLEDRVSKLEKIKPAVDIHGTLDFLVLAAHSTDKNFGMTPDNRILGEGAGSYAGKPVGLSRDLQVLHEAAFKVNGTNETGPKWEATIVAGNMLSSGVGQNALGDMSHQNMGNGFGAGTSDMYINTANVTFDSSLVGQGFNAKIGRVGYQVGPYMWKRSDYTGYFQNERWDNGDYYFDGGILSFNFGKAGVKVFGGTNNVQSNNGLAVNPMFFGGGMIDRTLGVQLNFPVGEMGAINLAYLWFDSDTLIPDVDPTTAGLQSANRINVFGGDINLKFDKFKVWGAYSQSTLSENTSNSLDSKNKAWDVRGMYDAGNWGAGLGYREVENFFAAPGSWGRIGNQWSPRNIKGFNAKLWFQPSTQTKIWGKGEFLEPKDATAGFAYAGYDKMRSFTVGLDYQMTDNWGAMFSYEDVKFDGNAPTNDDKMRWYTVGFNYGLGANTSLMLTYQFSDNDFGAGSFLDPMGVSPVGGRKYKGGLFGTQLSVKF